MRAPAVVTIMWRIWKSPYGPRVLLPFVFRGLLRPVSPAELN